LWRIASIKKSILFDVICVIDRANRIKSKKTVRFEYSLLKAETVKKYDTLYRAAKNQNELLAAAFYVPSQNLGDNHETSMCTYLIDKALDMVSFKEMIKFLEKSKAEDIAYYIAAMCLSTKEKQVSIKDVGEIVKQGDFKLIEELNKTTLSERVKMSAYMIVFNYKEFLLTLINHMKKTHDYICMLYLEYSHIYKRTKKVLFDFMHKKDKLSCLINEIKERVNDEKPRKHIIVISLIRLEYGRIKQSQCTIYYNRGIFLLQRIMHSSEFIIF